MRIAIEERVPPYSEIYSLIQDLFSNKNSPIKIINYQMTVDQWTCEVDIGIDAAINFKDKTAIALILIKYDFRSHAPRFYQEVIDRIK